MAKQAKRHQGIEVPDTGLKFPATATVSADPNTLDFYQEGTWTPVLSFGGATTGITYGASRYGHYTRIGNRVFFTCYFVLASKGSAPTGAPRVSGLPFNGLSQDNGGTATVALWGSGFSSLNGVINAYVNTVSGSVVIDFDARPVNADAGAAYAVNQNNFTNTAAIMVSGSYPV
jgi:hypothetical protein